jgi:A/G-specific adenine glycosylase
MPWRDRPTPYNVMVSEIMLQQTQVPRVVPKFLEFTARFPDITALADAPLADVLSHWSGLGYNRRAKFLHEAAKAVVRDFGGTLPASRDELVRLPGIGPNTAGAILAYAYEQPVVFIETNIRTVIIHHFFADSDEPVSDAQIKEIMEVVLPLEHPREWYWALMDYGTHIKATVGAQLKRVQGYKKQSAFNGSRRQVRGQVLRKLLAGGQTTLQLKAIVTDSRLPEVLAALQQEGLIILANEQWYLTGHEV